MLNVALNTMNPNQRGIHRWVRWSLVSFANSQHLSITFLVNLMNKKKTISAKYLFNMIRVKPVLPSDIWYNKTVLTGQDNVTFRYRWLLDRGNHMGTFDCNVIKIQTLNPGHTARFWHYNQKKRQHSKTCFPIPLMLCLLIKYV